MAMTCKVFRFVRVPDVEGSLIYYIVEMLLVLSSQGNQVDTVSRSSGTEPRPQNVDQYFTGQHVQLIMSLFAEHASSQST